MRRSRPVLSRIWGGIHPPADDIPGRLIGYRIGHDAFNLAETYFEGVPGELLTVDNPKSEVEFSVFPSPALNGEAVQVSVARFNGNEEVFVYDILGRLVLRETLASPQYILKNGPASFRTIYSSIDGQR